MARSVIITTPIPSVEEVAERLGMGKARLRRIQQIVDGTYSPETSKVASAGLNARHRDTAEQISQKRADAKLRTMRKK